MPARPVSCCASYNPASLPLSIPFGTGDSDSFTYDSNTNRPTQYKFTVGSSPQSFVGNLTWNANGTLGQLAITDPFNSANAQTCNYGHDDLVRIATANCGSAANQSFSYDPFGNLSKSGSPNSFQPTYNSATNRFASIPGCSSLSYDSNGNVLNDCVHTYTWDADGNPVTMDSVGLTFDALDRMVEQNRAGSYTQLVYAPTGNKFALMTGQTLQKAIVPLPGGAIAVYNSSGLLYLGHSDHLGSIRFASTPSRTMYFDLAYAPFGEPYAASGSTDAAFTGQRQDTTTGDYDFLYRPYSTQGRWASPDPSGLAAVDPSNPQSWNRYAYVLNNPLSFIDPDGLVCVWEDGSYDAADDQDTGTEEGCRAQGGAFIGDTMGGKWSDQPDNGLAGDYQDVMAMYDGQQLTTIQTVVWGTELTDDPAASDTEAFTHAWTRIKSFFTFAGGPGNVPTCAEQTLKHIGNDMVDLTGLAKAQTAEAILKGASVAQTARAWRYAANQVNTYGGKGLMCPSCSSTFRSMAKTGKLLGEASEAVPVVEAGVDAAMSIPEVKEQARYGRCAAAFPIF